MSDGYLRQSSAEMVNGQTANASDFNNEFNALQSAFDVTVGHTHDGSTAGTGAPITYVNITNTQNATSQINITNASAGGSADACFDASNGSIAVRFGILGTGFSTSGNRVANAVEIFSATSAGLAIQMTDGPVSIAAGGTTECFQVNSTGVEINGGSTLTTYVTGTWTPGLAFNGSSTGVTASTSAGKYVQLGNMVTAWYDITLSAMGSTSGAATITGLPVTAGVSAGSNGAVSPVWYIGMTSITGSVGALVAFGSTTANLFDTAATQVNNLLRQTNFTNTTTITGCLIYTSN